MKIKEIKIIAIITTILVFIYQIFRFGYNKAINNLLRRNLKKKRKIDKVINKLSERDRKKLRKKYNRQ